MHHVFCRFLSKSSWNFVRRFFSGKIWRSALFLKKKTTASGNVKKSFPHANSVALLVPALRRHKSTTAINTVVSEFPKKTIAGDGRMQVGVPRKEGTGRQCLRSMECAPCS